MTKMFKCINKGDYWLTTGKNYMITLNVAKSEHLGAHHILINDIGAEHIVFEGELDTLFIDIEKIRQEKLEQLGI